MAPSRSRSRRWTSLFAVVATTSLVVAASPASATDLPVDPPMVTASPDATTNPTPSTTSPTSTTDAAPTASPSTSTTPTTDPAPTASPSTSTAPTTHPAPTAAAGAASSTQNVSYGSVTVSVPSSWSVVDLAADPTACVRLDVHAVYLGTQAGTAECPPGLVGRTESLHLETRPTSSPFGAVDLATETAVTTAQQTAGEITGIVPSSSILLTATFGADQATALAVARSAHATPAPVRSRMAAMATTQTTLSVAAPAPIDRSFTWHHGPGFDACTAPTVATMSAWLASPFRSIGIYIGGSQRGCAQPNLTPGWLRTVAASGWKVAPIYVGVQAPCTSFSARIVSGQEWQQGQAAANDAADRAQALGLGAGSDIYYDMESYSTNDVTCSGLVRAFIASWTNTLHARGYSSGVYSSLSSGIRDMANGGSQPGFVYPDKIWYARWQTPPTPKIYGLAPYVPDNMWSLYQRSHQYQGGHYETWGGVTINIDSDLHDTDPNSGNPVGRVDSASGGPSRVSVTGWALDPDTPGPIIVQAYIDGSYAGMARADGARADVASAFPGTGTLHGYSISAQAAPGAHQVCVYGVNVGPGFSSLLTCATAVATSSDPFGQIDSVTGDPGTISASGWSVDPDTSASTIVQMYVDGSFAAMASANGTRADVGAAYPGAGSSHGWSLATVAAPGTHQVCVYAVNIGPGTSSGLGCRTAVTPSPDPRGALDSATASRGVVTASGWALDPNTSGPIIVQLYLDGAANTMAWTGLARPDVAAAIPGAGPATGYSLSVPAAAGVHTACVYAVNVGPGTSASLGCQRVSA